jgi:hypothetical protein
VRLGKPDRINRVLARRCYAADVDETAYCRSACSE